MVASKQLWLAVETEEERRARLENDAATKWLRLAMEMDKERKASLEKMVATTELMLALIGVQTHSEKLALCLSFKLDVHRHPQLNIDHELLSASVILLFIYLITYTL